VTGTFEALYAVASSAGIMFRKGSLCGSVPLGILVRTLGTIDCARI